MIQQDLRQVHNVDGLETLRSLVVRSRQGYTLPDKHLHHTHTIDTKLSLARLA